MPPTAVSRRLGRATRSVARIEVVRQLTFDDPDGRDGLLARAVPRSRAFAKDLGDLRAIEDGLVRDAVPHAVDRM